MKYSVAVIFYVDVEADDQSEAAEKVHAMTIEEIIAVNPNGAYIDEPQEVDDEF